MHAYPYILLSKCIQQLICYYKHFIKYKLIYILFRLFAFVLFGNFKATRGLFKVERGSCTDFVFLVITNKCNASKRLQCMQSELLRFGTYIIV